jgi:hypothetical protein
MISDEVKYKPFTAKTRLTEEELRYRFDGYDNKMAQKNFFFDDNNGWLIGQTVNGYKEVDRLVEYAKSKLGDVEIKPRFYVQRKDVYVPEHKDIKTECAINILLSDDCAPITYKDFGDIYYKCALINTQEIHSVKTDTERILFKLSIMDMKYEIAASRLVSVENK